LNRSFDRYLINGQKPDYRLKLEVPLKFGQSSKVKSFANPSVQLV
jgi:hypothetical protein